MSSDSRTTRSSYIYILYKKVNILGQLNCKIYFFMLMLRRVAGDVFRFPNKKELFCAIFYFIFSSDSPTTKSSFALFWATARSC